MNTPYLIAKSIVEKLQKHGYKAYFAGGFVRDFLLKKETQDIDIATSALPQDIIKLFNKTVPVGISFGVVVVIEKNFSFEIATFREDGGYQDGRHPESISLDAAPKEDAIRRDFTINGLFFDPVEEKVYDFVDGQKDLKKRLIRAIGNPFDRFNEDRLRMIRAARFAARLEFTIEDLTVEAIQSLSYKLFPAVSVERVIAELEKMRPYFISSILKLFELDLLKVIFPEIASISKLELKKRLEPTSNFDSKTSIILYLIQLLNLTSILDVKNLVKRFKMKNEDITHASMWFELLSLTQGANTLKWVRFYAKKNHMIILAMYQAIHFQKEINAFHSEQKEALSFYIQLEKEKKSLVTGQDLKHMGMIPGKRMGLLLEELKQLAIDHNIQTKDQLLEKASSLGLIENH